MKMYWNEDSGRSRGGERMPCGGRLFDANGLEWSSVTWCDTERGEIERFVRDENGKLIRDGDGVRMELIQTAAPLRYVPKGDEP